MTRFCKSNGLSCQVKLYFKASVSIPALNQVLGARNNLMKK